MQLEELLDEHHDIFAFNMNEKIEIKDLRSSQFRSRRRYRLAKAIEKKFSRSKSKRGSKPASYGRLSPRGQPP
jgi:hypothetical protein